MKQTLTKKAYSELSSPSSKSSCRLITDFFSVSPSKAPTSDTEHVGSSPRKLTKKKSSVSRQLYFDVGQPLYKTCLECQMRYSESFDTDIRLHQRFHTAYLKGIKFPAWVLKRSTCTLLGSHQSFVFYKIEKYSGDAMQPIMELINQELEAADQIREELDALEFMIALADEGKRVAALLAIDTTVRESFIAQEDHEQMISISDPNPVEALIGVNRIWTDKTFRRRGLASGLLALTIRESSLDPARDRHLVAFSQPTHAGYSFATKFCGACRVYVSNQIPQVMSCTSNPSSA